VGERLLREIPLKREGEEEEFQTCLSYLITGGHTCRINVIVNKSFKIIQYQKSFYLRIRGLSAELASELWSTKKADNYLKALCSNINMYSVR